MLVGSCLGDEVDRDQAGGWVRIVGKVEHRVQKCQVGVERGEYRNLPAEKFEVARERSQGAAALDVRSLKPLFDRLLKKPRGSVVPPSLENDLGSFQVGTGLAPLRFSFHPHAFMLSERGRERGGHIDPPP
jgi:hypothetical protein